MITREEVKETRMRFRANYADTINFIVSCGYLVRYSGVYYVKTLEEFKLRKPTEAHRVISLA